MNDEIWDATTMVVLLGFRMYADLISHTTFGGGETWSVCRVRLCQAELNSVSLCVVLICWALRNRFGSLLINC